LKSDFDVATLPQGTEIIDEVDNPTPKAILATREVQQQGSLIMKWLILWKSQPMEEASWELAASIQSKFPNFFLEVKANFRDDGIDRNQSQSNTSQRTYHGYTEAYRGSLQRKLKEEE